MAPSLYSFTLLCFFFLFHFFTINAYPVHHNYPFHRHHHPHFASHNYRDALTKSILFFEGQRSGSLPSNQRITWRRNSGLSDGAAMHVINKTLFLFSFLVLLWIMWSGFCSFLGCETWNAGWFGWRVLWCRGQCEVWFPYGFHHHYAFMECYWVWWVDEKWVTECQRSHSLGHWLPPQSHCTSRHHLCSGLFSLCSALSLFLLPILFLSNYVILGSCGCIWAHLQVGDANKDHACWERPEDMDTPRSVFKVDKNSPGSDVAAETAAALASASLVFRRSDPTYSNLLVTRAIRVKLFN